MPIRPSDANFFQTPICPCKQRIMKTTGQHKYGRKRVEETGIRTIVMQTGCTVDLFSVTLCEANQPSSQAQALILSGQRVQKGVDVSRRIIEMGREAQAVAARGG